MPRRIFSQIKSERAFYLVAALFFAALVLINFAPVFLGKVPLPAHFVTQFPVWSEFKSRQAWQPAADIGDTITYFYPFNGFSAQQIRHGILPLWNPYLMAGMPFQAEPQSALFYPLHALYYLFPTPAAWSLALMLRMVLGAMFMTLLLRSIGATRTGALVSGIAFAFGGFVLAWQGAVMGDAVIWLPLVCYSVLRLHNNRSKRSVALAAFAFAMPVLAGHPETAIHLTLIGIAAALLLWAFSPRREARFDLQFLLRFSLAGLLAIGLSAVQLAPTLEWVRQSGRAFNVPWNGSFGLHQALGFFSRDALRGPNSAGIFVPNALGYVGMFTLLAAALAALHRSSRYVIWFFGLVVIGLAATFGFEPIRWVLNHAPVLKGLKNERLVLLVDFGLAALAGLGISMLQEEPAERSVVRRVLPWCLLAAAFILAMAGVHQLQLATQFKVEIMRRPSFSRTLLLSGFVVVAWRLIRLQRAKLFPFIALAVVVFDLATFAYGYTTFNWPDEIFPPAPVFEFLNEQARTESFRIAPMGLTYPENSGMAYGMQSLTGFEAAVPPPLNRFVLDFTEGYPESVVPIAEKVLSTADRRFDMLNVKYVVVTTSSPEYEVFARHPERFSQVFKREKVVVFENKTALPRAFLVGAAGVELVKGDKEQIEAVKRPIFDPLQAVVVDALPGELVEAAPASEFRGRVETLATNVNGYRFRVQASTPGVLVVSQNYYPGWKAIVNGRSASVFPADHALTGIAVPAGDYQVDFEFQPSSFKLGAVLTLISVTLLGGLLVSRRHPATTSLPVS